MKYLITSLLLCFSLFSLGQTYTPIHNAQAIDWLQAPKAFFIPKGTTPALNTTKLDPGALFFRTTDSTLYLWTGTQWLASGSGGGGSTDTANLSARLDTMTKIFIFDNNFTISRNANGDTNYVFLNPVLSPDRLIEVGGIVLTNVNRVTVLNVIKFSRKGVTLIGDSAGFTIPFEPDGIFRSYALVIGSDGLIDTLRGVTDSFTLVPPDLRPGDILVGYIDVFGSSIQVSQASANQRYSVRYIDPVSGLETGDSTAFKWDPAAKTLSIGANNGSSQSAGLLMNAGRFVMIASFNGVQLNVGSGTGASGVMDVSKTILFTNRGTPLANFSAENDSIGYLRLRKGIGLKMDGLVNNSAEDSAITVDFTTKKFKMKKFAGSGGSGWGLTGNSGTDTTTDFIGTTDGNYVQLRSNNNKVATFGFDFSAAIGELNVATGQALATGFNTRAINVGAFSAGIRDTSENVGTFTSGVNSKANGDYATAIGQNNKASGIGAIAINGFTKASGDYSFAFGTGNISSGENAVSGGSGSAAKGSNSFAFGDANITNGDKSVALNAGNVANGENSFVAGNSSTTNGESSAAFGTGNFANGQSSFVAGVQNRADANASVSFGIGTIAKSYGQTAVGYYNDTTDAGISEGYDEGNTVFSVGYGTNDGDRKNALTVKGSGNVGIGTATPDASAILDISSTTKGFLIPRMTNSEKNDLAAPADGLMIYQTTDIKGFYYYDGNKSEWQPVGGAVSTVYSRNDELTSNRSVNAVDFDFNIKNVKDFFVAVETDPDCDGSISLYAIRHIDIETGGGEIRIGDPLDNGNNNTLLISDSLSIREYVKGGQLVERYEAGCNFGDLDSLFNGAILHISDHGDSATLKGNFRPDRDNTYDLGSDFSRWKNLYVGGVVNLAPYTVATLPAGSEGDYARVTDALAPTYGATVVGGGIVGTPVFFTAGAWTVH